MRTTLNQIRSHSPCRAGWEKLLRGLGKFQADDDPLWIDEVLNINGLGDAVWCLRAVGGCDREIRMFAVWCARRVQHLATDPRSIAALDVVERHARGEASDEESGEAQRILEMAKWRAAADATEDMASTASLNTARARARSWAAISANAAATNPAAAALASAAASAWASAAASAWAAAENWAATAAEVAAWSARNAERAAQANELRRICREMR
jgi:hypothetical protein